MTERDKVKARIAKLLNMTLDRGASESEALHAAEKAAELMTHYDIEASELAIRASHAIRQAVAERKYGSMYIGRPTARHIAQLCDCMYWIDAEVDPRTPICRQCGSEQPAPSSFSVCPLTRRSPAICSTLSAMPLSRRSTSTRRARTISVS